MRSQQASPTFQLSQLSNAGELHLPLRRYLASHTAEADFSKPRGAVVDDELSESVQLEVIPILCEMVNERVLQTGDEHVDEAVCFLPRDQIECSLNSQRQFFTFLHELLSPLICLLAYDLDGTWRFRKWSIPRKAQYFWKNLTRGKLLLMMMRTPFETATSWVTMGSSSRTASASFTNDSRPMWRTG